METGICTVSRKTRLTTIFLAVGTLLAALGSNTLWGAGDNWISLGPEHARVEAVLLDAQNPEIVYAGINGLGFAKCGEAKNLTASNDGLLSSIVLSLAEDPHHSGILYAGTGGAGVYKSSDAGKSWAPANKGIDFKTVQSLVADPNREDTLYAGTWGDGVFV